RPLLSRNDALQTGGPHAKSAQDATRRSRNQTGGQPDSTQRPQRFSQRVAEEMRSLRSSAPTLASSALRKSSRCITKLEDSTAERQGNVSLRHLVAPRTALPL